jgi:dihydrofolate reductase
MSLNLILARARNGIIGKNNTLPWHLPEDLAHFKTTTMGCPVLMGRKTWESLPEKFRPLPGRDNFVLSRSSEFTAKGARIVHSVQDALDLVQSDKDLWVIGGANVYAQCMELAKHAVITEIEADFEGDAYSPVFDASWVEDRRIRHTALNGLVYSLVYLNKKGES